MKKALSIVLALCMLTGILSVAAYAGDAHLPLQKDDVFSVGDANDDGAVNALDAYAVKTHVVFGTEIVDEAADLNADGSANARDVLFYKTLFAELSSLSDYENTQRVYKLTIAGNDISDYDIVIPEDAIYNIAIPGDEDFDVDPWFRRSNAGGNDNCTFAADILQEFIQKTTGVSLDIVRGESSKPHMIYCHKIDQYGEEAKELGLDIEDYIYEVKDGDLHIYGTLRGCMYAAYEIVENYLGLKFYCDRFTYSKKLRVSDIPEGTHVYHETEMEMRFSGTHSNNDTAYDYYFPRRQNAVFLYGCNDLRHGLLTGPIFGAAHTFYDYYFCGIGDDPGPDYPDIRNRYYVKWKSKITDAEMRYRAYEWQPCTSPNPADTIDSESPSDYAILYQGMLDLIQMEKDWGYDPQTYYDHGQLMVSASINDNGHFCDCRICTRKATGGTPIKLSSSAKKCLDGYTGEYTVDSKGYYTFTPEGYAGVYVDFTMRFARDLQEVWPGVRAMTIIYDHTIPATIKPDEYVVIWYCGHYCNQHVLGSGDCGDNVTMLGGSNTLDETALKWWADACHEAGTTIWFWEYAVNYHYQLAPAPCVMDMWGNYHYILDVCDVDGMNYEGTNFCGNKNDEYNFENLKCYMSDLMMWDPHMTYDEFVYNVKDFLYMFYGEGYEDIYEFIQYQQAAGDANEICFVVNHDRPWEMYSQDYIVEHYEEARACIDRALAKATEDFQRERVKNLYMSWDFLYLSAAYDDIYTNGTTESRALFEERYTALWNRLNDNNFPIFSDDSVYVLPEEIDFDTNPMIQFYGHGSDRPGITP